MAGAVVEEQAGPVARERLAGLGRHQPQQPVEIGLGRQAQRRLQQAVEGRHALHERLMIHRPVERHGCKAA
jgi:hypothetical protein